MCFGLAWFEDLLIWVVIICAIVALLKLLVSFILPRIGGLSAEVINFVASAVRILIWAIVLIFAIIFIFDLISCLAGNLHMPRLGPR